MVRTLKFDVMVGDMFYRTLRMPIELNMLRKVGNDIAVDITNIEKFVLDKCPTLKGKKWHIAFYD